MIGSWALNFMRFIGVMFYKSALSKAFRQTPTTKNGRDGLTSSSARMPSALAVVLLLPSGFALLLITEILLRIHLRLGRTW